MSRFTAAMSNTSANRTSPTSATRANSNGLTRELGDQLAAADRRPSLLLNATADPYVPPDMVFDVAERIGAEILTLEGLGHWWMFENPRLVGDGLVAFWSEHAVAR